MSGAPSVCMLLAFCHLGNWFMVVRWNEKAHTVTNLKYHAICNFTYLNMGLQGSRFFWKANCQCYIWPIGLMAWLRLPESPIWTPSYDQVVTRAQLGSWLKGKPCTSLGVSDYSTSQSGFPHVDQPADIPLTDGSPLAGTYWLSLLSIPTHDPLLLHVSTWSHWHRLIWKPLGLPSHHWLPSISQSAKDITGFSWFLLVFRFLETW